MYRLPSNSAQFWRDHFSIGKQLVSRYKQLRSVACVDVRQRRLRNCRSQLPDLLIGVGSDSVEAIVLFCERYGLWRSVARTSKF